MPEAWCPDLSRTAAIELDEDAIGVTDVDVPELPFRVDEGPLGSGRLYPFGYQFLSEGVHVGNADGEVGDDFESLYKGEISKSGTPILPSKRARKTPEKIQVSNDDLAELSQTAKPDIDTSATDETGEEQGDVSLDEVNETENQTSEQDTSNETENN
mgnify:CR=1 FL=1